MSVTTFDPAKAVTLTASAERHFHEAVAAKPGAIVRLSTKESGCTGYAYILDLADGPQADDVVIDVANELKLAVAANAIALVQGTEIDMVTEGVNRVVKFNNPNVVAECGCGESFSVK